MFVGERVGNLTISFNFWLLLKKSGKVARPRGFVGRSRLTRRAHLASVRLCAVGHRQTNPVSAEFRRVRRRSLLPRGDMLSAGNTDCNVGRDENQATAR